MTECENFEVTLCSQQDVKIQLLTNLFFKSYFEEAGEERKGKTAVCNKTVKGKQFFRMEAFVGIIPSKDDVLVEIVKLKVFRE